MKKSLLIPILMVFIITGCQNVNNTTLYIIKGDYSTYEEKDNIFIIVDSEKELLEIKSSIKLSSENGSLESELIQMKTYFKKNQIGFLYKIDNNVKYKFMFAEDTDFEE